MVLLSMHFTLARGGWLALVALTALTAFGAFTGDCIVESYKTVSVDSSFPSYAEIGARCLGAFGKWLVVASSLIENFFATLCMLIIMWENMQLLLPDVEPSVVLAGSIALLFPTNFIRDFSVLSFLSAVGLGCIVLIIAVIMFDVTCAVAAPSPEVSLDHPRQLIDLAGMPMAGSIMLAGLTGHVGLPPMYAEMKTPSAFRKTLCAAFVAMLAMYGIVGVGGYLLYGNDASVLITADMANAAGFDPSRKALTSLVLGCITFKLFCGIPVCVLVLADVFKDLRFERTGKQFSETAADGLRLAIWSAAVVFALAIKPWLQYITALIGINSMLISVVLPLIFQFQLRRRLLGPTARAAYLSLVVLSIMATCYISYVDVIEFMEMLESVG